MNTQDPYNEFADILPLTVADAAKVLRIMTAEFALAQEKVAEAQRMLAFVTTQQARAEYAVKRAEHCLKISALADLKDSGGAA
jgi:hypothetical protein